MWNLSSFRLETVFVSMQDRCMVCATHSIGLNRFGCTQWNSEVARLKWKLVVVRLEIVRILMQDRCMVCAERTIGSKIILDAPDRLLGDMGHVESLFFPFGDSVSVGAWFALDVP